jgi:hypothetical protein
MWVHLAEDVWKTNGQFCTLPIFWDGRMGCTPISRELAYVKLYYDLVLTHHQYFLLLERTMYSWFMLEYDLFVHSVPDIGGGDMDRLAILWVYLAVEKHIRDEHPIRFPDMWWNNRLQVRNMYIFSA